MSGEHASASASSTRRSLPETGEFAHTQFIPAMLTAAASPRAQPCDPGRLTRGRR